VSTALNIVDSSGWISVVTHGQHAEVFLSVIEGGALVVPSISIFEVTKRIRLLASEKEAKQVEAHMRRFKVLELTADRASQASRLSSEFKMPMADSIIYAAALEVKATLWTQDDDFKGKRGVKYFALK
jgi:toxin FitB